MEIKQINQIYLFQFFFLFIVIQAAMSTSKPKKSRINQPAASVASSVASSVSKPQPQSKKSTAASAKPPTISKAKQSEQQSMISLPNPRKFFKGWSSSDKPSSNIDPRSTVTEMGSQEDSKDTYEKLVTDCLAKKVLWEDPDFPAENKSLYFSKPSVTGKIEWKRPKVRRDGGGGYYNLCLFE